MNAKVGPPDPGVESTVRLLPLDRAWLIQSVETQIKALSRNRDKERTGGDVWNFRTKELEQLVAVRDKIK